MGKFLRVKLSELGITRFTDIQYSWQEKMLSIKIWQIENEKKCFRAPRKQRGQAVPGTRFETSQHCHLFIMIIDIIISSISLYLFYHYLIMINDHWSLIIDIIISSLSNIIIMMIYHGRHHYHLTCSNKINYHPRPRFETSQLCDLIKP